MDDLLLNQKLGRIAKDRQEILSQLQSKSISEVASENGLSRQTLYNWRKQLANTGKLEPQKRGGSRKRTPEIPEDEVIQLTRDHRPIDMGYSSRLWTITSVKQLIQDRYKRKVPIRKVRRLLMSWNLYPTVNFFPHYRNKWALSNLKKKLHELAVTNHSQVHLIDALKQSNQSDVCFYARTLTKSNVKFMYWTGKNDYSGKIPINVDFVKALQKTARKRIIVVYKPPITIKQLGHWQKNQEMAQIQLLDYRKITTFYYNECRRNRLRRRSSLF